MINYPRNPLYFAQIDASKTIIGDKNKREWLVTEDINEAFNKAEKPPFFVPIDSIPNHDLMALVIHFRNQKQNSFNQLQRLLQINSLDENADNPELYMNDSDKSQYLAFRQTYFDACSWLPIFEDTAMSNGLHGELNA